MAKIQIELGTVLAQVGITVNKLAQHTSTHQNTLYRWVNHPQESINLDGLADVIRAIRELTGQQIEVRHLLVYKED